VTKLKLGNKWMRDFGSGLTEDVEKAYEFTPDEAVALCALHKGYAPDAYSYGEGTVLDNRSSPDINPGDDMVWVRFNGCWFAAERQALFVGTRNALRAHGVQQPMIA